MLNSDKQFFTFSHKTELCVVWAASIFSYIYSRVIIDIEWKSTIFSSINEKTGEIRSTNFKREKLKIDIKIMRDFHFFFDTIFCKAMKSTKNKTA